MITVASPADAKRQARRLLDRETADVWRQYADTCRRAAVYEAVEPFAWDRLQHALRQIAVRRKRLDR